MDLIGLPWRITVGPRGLAAGTVELTSPPHRRERGDVAGGGGGALRRDLRGALRRVTQRPQGARRSTRVRRDRRAPTAAALALDLPARRTGSARRTRGRPRADTAPPPFAAFEWLIAWRYLRARRREGGISVIAWYALIGVMLGVATLIVVQAVMIGFREEFTDRILGANAHVTVYYAPEPDATGTPSRLIADYDDLAARLAAVPGVTRAAPLIRGQVMASANGRASGVEVIGTRLDDLAGGAAGRAARRRRRAISRGSTRASPSAPGWRASSASGSATW